MLNDVMVIVISCEITVQSEMCGEENIEFRIVG